MPTHTSSDPASQLQVHWTEETKGLQKMHKWIFQKMLAADIVVFSTPVYFFTLSAQLKTLIDRLHNGYKKMAGKKFCFIAAVSVPEPERLERTFDSMRGLLDCILDSEELGVVCGNNAWLAGEVKATKAYDEAYELISQVRLELCSTSERDQDLLIICTDCKL